MNWNARRENLTQQTENAREDGDVDYGRVIHSASFRRLQGMTKILSLWKSDFYRTRLTHSLEVAGNIARQFGKSFPEHPAAAHLPDRDMIHAIGCKHDLAHPPSCHGGEVALNYCVRDHGGLKGNGQKLWAPSASRASRRWPARTSHGAHFSVF